MPHCIRIFLLIRPDPFQLRRNVTVQSCLWDQRGLEVLVINEIRSGLCIWRKSAVNCVITHMHTSIVFNELFQDKKPENSSHPGAHACIQYVRKWRENSWVSFDALWALHE